jgi:AcrR family transcriptional regulator
MTTRQARQRESQRQDTREEIKAFARQQMAAEGTAALSLRAIARDMEMTAPALYRYFPSREDLITALIVDAFNALADALEAADAAPTQQDYGSRLRAVLMAYRGWALEHPTDFQLIYGNPIPGYSAPRELTVPAPDGRGAAGRTTLYSGRSPTASSFGGSAFSDAYRQ